MPAKNSPLRFLLAFVLAVQSPISFAQSPDFVEKALEKEKQFFLALTTGYNGERDIGIKPYGKPTSSKLVFYVDDSRCKSEECFSKKAEAIEVAQRFASDYNSLVGHEYISVTKEKSFFSSAISIYLVEGRSARVSGDRAYWSCFIEDSGRWRNCGVRIATLSNPNFNNHVAHEMLNITGLQDTLQRDFKDCLSYDASGKSSVYKGLCEIEAKAILFSKKHLRPGMRVGEISNIFDKYWKPSDFTHALAKKLEERERLDESFKEIVKNLPESSAPFDRPTEEQKNSVFCSSGSC